VESIRIHGIGGECHFSGPARPLDVSIIAWGGVLAQAMVFGATYALLSFGLVPSEPLLGSMFHVWLEPNLVLIGLNLLPLRPFDGAEAWKIFGRLRRRKRRPDPKPAREEGDPLVVDPQRVADSVRDALERARRESREHRERQR
jgi:hypothetical protein